MSADTPLPPALGELCVRKQLWLQQSEGSLLRVTGAELLEAKHTKVCTEGRSRVEVEER